MLRSVLLPFALLGACSTARVLQVHAQSAAQPTVTSTQITGRDALPQGPLAPSLFPQNMEATYKPHESVKSWTCNWAVDCRHGLAPIFHTGDAESLGRTGGWRQLELKSWKHVVNGKRVTTQIGFAFAPSTFNRTVKFLKVHAPRAPYEDFIDVQYGLGLLPNAAQPALLAPESGGRSTYMTLRRGTSGYWAAAWYHDSVDIEAVAVCTECSAARMTQTQTEFLAAIHVLAGR